MLELYCFSPGFISWTMSGTTTSVPVKTARSPGFALSTVSPRRITSIERGIEPAGISAESSCRRTFYQSMYTLFELSRLNSLLKQRSLSHLMGSVYLYSYSIPDVICMHYLHWNEPIYSSGFTSVVRVTVPWIERIFPRLRVFISLIFCTAGRL